MKIFIVFISLVVLCFDVKAGDYKGGGGDFKQFVKQYGLSWTIPDKLDFFESPYGKGAIRYAHWVPESGSSNKVVIHFNGRTEFIEKNIYTYEELLKDGYEVWALDWRGQGMSVRSLRKKQKHTISTFDEYVKDANYFIDEVVKIKNYSGKKVLLAHSMGGQIALRYLLQDQSSLFDFAVLSSPLLKIPGDSFWLRAGNNIKRLFLKNSCVLSKSKNWTGDFERGHACSLIGLREIPESELIDGYKTRKYSNDYKKLAEINCLIESSEDGRGKDEPDLRIACPTSNWLNAALKSTDITMEAAGKLSVPTLIVRVNPDSAVDTEGQDEFCQLSENCFLETVPNIDGVQPGHEILIENEEFRQFFFEKFRNHVGY